MYVPFLDFFLVTAFDVKQGIFIIVFVVCVINQQARLEFLIYIILNLLFI